MLPHNPDVYNLMKFRHVIHEDSGRKKQSNDRQFWPNLYLRGGSASQLKLNFHQCIMKIYNWKSINTGC